MNAEYPKRIREQRETRDLMDRLDQAVPPDTHAVDGAEGDPLVDAARRLAQAPDVRLPNVSLNRIEARLRAHTRELHAASAAAQPAPPTPRQPLPGLSRRVTRPKWQRTGRLWRYAAAACLALILTVSGLTRASASSLPGDHLYPLKRAVEAQRLALVTDDNEPGLRVELAGRRVKEFDRLLSRDRVYPRALEEAAGHMTWAVDLLTDGYGSWATLGPRMIHLVDLESLLITRAMYITSPEVQARLAAVAARNDEIRLLIKATLSPPEDGEPPTDPAVEPGVTPTETGTPDASPTPSYTATPADTRTPSPTATPSSTATPSITPTPSLTPTPTGMTPAPLVTYQPPPTTVPEYEEPTRTPPGHGPTPGLGDSPPGQGGDNPGVGNDGQPPGQEDKPDKDKDKGKEK